MQTVGLLKLPCTSLLFLEDIASSIWDGMGGWGLSSGCRETGLSLSEELWLVVQTWTTGRLKAQALLGGGVALASYYEHALRERRLPGC